MVQKWQWADELREPSRRPIAKLLVRSFGLVDSDVLPPLCLIPVDAPDAPEPDSSHTALRLLWTAWLRAILSIESRERVWSRTVDTRRTNRSRGFSLVLRSSWHFARTMHRTWSPHVPADSGASAGTWLSDFRSKDKRYQPARGLPILHPGEGIICEIQNSFSSWTSSRRRPPSKINGVDGSGKHAFDDSKNLDYRRTFYFARLSRYAKACRDRREF